MRYVFGVAAPWSSPPLWATLAASILLLGDLGRKLLSWQISSDLLAGVSIVASALLGEYLVGAIIVLMLSGGAALERYATARASAVLDALARRMPQIAHRRAPHGVEDVAVGEVGPGDLLVVYPHEICPADGVVTSGHGTMDESYLTGEPFLISKAPGAAVLSGAVNGEMPLEITTTRKPRDSRYAQIMRVMEENEDRKPKMRRLADRIGAWYTPLALSMAALGWAVSGDPLRFLSVVVIATPCPLLIAIPVAVVGAISLSARRGIVIKNPAALELVGDCRIWIFDKTGTLTYGRPVLTAIDTAPGVEEREVLQLAASLELYSKHPLANAIRKAAEQRGLGPSPVISLSEKPGEGLRGLVDGRAVVITGRQHTAAWEARLPPQEGGLECIVLLDGDYAATMRFRDEPRADSRSFIAHLSRRHRAARLILLSGDRASEAECLARAVGIEKVYASKSPEEKVEVVLQETATAPTLYVGDGINDAPAMRVATVGVTLGTHSDITAEAGDAVVLEATLQKVDELVHIGGRMRVIALQSALGGMALSMAGMVLAVIGQLPPIGGAVAQEVIDLAAVLNALRVAFPREELSDF
ncbi:MAG: cadmium-translocating P-type ATPase [Bryobacterales bacterium]|nr:cadmium-translocating P-type ATPase [Bryobacterales bacterium]